MKNRAAKRVCRALELLRLEDRSMPSVFAGSGAVSSGAVPAETVTATAYSSNGQSVIVWGGASSSHVNRPVFAQRFAADRTPLGVPIQVTPTSNIAWGVGVAMDASGGFVVSWTKYDGVGFSQDIFAARFSNTGAAIGSAFAVSASTVNESGSKVAVAENGSFLIVHHRHNASFRLDVIGVRYSNTGVRLGDFVVATNVRDAGVSMNVTGAFAVAYADQTTVQVKRYAANGTVLGTHTLATESTNSGFVGTTGVAIDNAGNTVTTWKGTNGVRFRRVSATGVLGTTITLWADRKLIFARGSKSYSSPAIAMDRSDGDFVVTAQATTVRSGLELGSAVSLVVAEVSALGAVRAKHEFVVRDVFFSSSAKNTLLRADVAAGPSGYFTISYLSFDPFDSATAQPSVRRKIGRLY